VPAPVSTSPGATSVTARLPPEKTETSAAPAQTSAAAKAATAPAQAGTLSPIVVTANKIAEPQSEVTQSVRVLDDDEVVLRPSNQRNASELIRYEPGVFISPLSRNDANWGSYGGLGPKYNTYLLDGLPIDAFVDTMSLDPWAFERVESQRGPASVMYSNYLSSDFAGQQSPLAGTTNFILHNRIDAKRTRLSMGAGSYQTLEGRLYHQDHAGNLHYFFGATYEQSNYTNYGANPSWLNMQHDPAYQKSKAYGKVTYFFGRDDHYVSVFAQHTGHVGDTGRRNRDYENGYDTANLAYNNQLTAALNSQFKVGLRHYDRRWGDDYFGVTDAAGNLVPNQLALRDHAGVRQNIVPADLTFNVRHLKNSVFTVGADAQFAWYRTYTEPEGIRTTQNKATSLSNGLFAEEKLVIRDWVLRAGGRFSYLRNHFDLVDGGAPGLDNNSWTRGLWSAGVRYNALKELGFYANAGSSFVPPAAKSVAGTIGAADLGVAGRNGQLPNPNLKPESGIGMDVGTDVHPIHGLTLGARGFFNQASDAIIDNSVSANPSQTQSINSGKARSLGLEFVVDHRLGDIGWFANTTLVRSRVSGNPNPDQNDTQISFVPDVVANAGVTARLPERVTAALFVNGVGEFYDSTSRSGRKSFGPFIIPNLRVQKTVPVTEFDIDFILALNNIINKKYDLPWQFRDPGFNGMAYIQVTAD
jgi:outer membrane receptor protein involved in Fe transport